MTYADLIEDVRKLIGLELQSIRPGASITILDIDDEKDCLILKTAQGRTRSRPLSELRLIWDALTKEYVVHVEGVLHGSGTSRNQPETILANLPYIEWLRINNKKHIALISKSSHPFGTLREMSPLDAATLEKGNKDNNDSGKTCFVIVTPDISATISDLTAAFQGTMSTIENGIYTFSSSASEVLLLLPSRVNLVPGYYTVISKTQSNSTKTVEICDEEYVVVSESSSIKLLMRK